MAKSKQGICVYCGQEAVLTEDHVIPKCLFPNGIRAVAPKAWACQPCNGEKKSGLDEYFRDLLVTDMHSSQSPVAQQLFVKFSRSVARNRSKMARDMLQKALFVELRTESGLYAGQAYTTQEATAKTQEIMAMYVRGLYAYYIHNTLQQDMDFEFFRAGKSEKLNQTIGFLNENGGSYGRIGNGDIFECVFAHAAEVPEAGIWILNFFRRALFVVVATPKNLVKSA